MTTPNDDLRSLINAAAGANDSPKPAPGRSTASHPAPAATPTDDIRSLVQQAAGSSGNAGGAPESASAHPTADAKGALNRAIRSAKSIETRAARSATPNAGRDRTANPLDLSDAVQQAQADGDARAAVMAKPSIFKNPRVIASTLALALILLGLVIWKTTQPVLTGHPATLQQLAQSVEQYRALHNGKLPEQLSNLEHFPKNAVEWQPKHWRARDAAGRIEIMFAPNGMRHYRIVLRQGTEVWVYNDQNGQSKQTNP
jgi:hypothetical protein